jgi:hypothetical protein
VIPIAICLIATIFVWKYYWSNTQDISAPIDTTTVKGEEVDEEAAKAEE